MNPPSFDKSAASFPVKERTIVLTHCGIAPLYSGALRAQQEVAEAQCRTGALVFSRYDAILDSLRASAAQVLKTASDNLAFVKNTSEGINLIANGYPFQSGDQVISYVHEYPANHYPWKLQERRGVELVLLPDTASDRPVAWSLDDLKARITPRTRVIALSHVQFASGYRADLEAVAELCRAHDIDFVVDVAQSLGCLPFEPDMLGIAAAVSSGWKWLMGPIGCGLLYTSERFRAKLDLAMVGAETMQQGLDYLDHTWNPFASAKQFEYSTAPIALAAALDCCIRELTLRYGLDAIEAEIIRMQDVFLARLDSKRYRPVMTPEKQRTPILSLIVPGDANATRRALLKQNIICTERGGYLRVAPHFYNDDAEMERVADALNAIG